ncbi:hypothetical protein PsYK624_128670 [Phanerochaete sordida]|uniref:F-box domain-containing protein n=1 Tax=Phanerochaete sordida TaxID=48140 RepID=A0A9P3GK47_9APHY|nr:hypothetical protein PsYK624_128670 [Phanerochaete sordida]
MEPSSILSETLSPELSGPIPGKIAHNGTPSAAHRIPQELFKRIFMFLPPFFDICKDPSDRRHVGQRALVCRYWATYCRAPLFSNLRLRCAADVRQLLHFATINTLGRNVSDFVEDLCLIITLPTPPWVHQFLSNAPRDLFSPKDSREGRSELSLSISVDSKKSDSPPAGKQYTPRSFFHDLPRTLPLGVNAKFHFSTHFTGLHFATYEDLMHFVASWAHYKPYSKGITLDKITWEGMNITQPTEPPLLWAARRLPALYIHNVESYSSTAAWPLVWLFISTRRPPPRVAANTPIYVCSEDACHVVALVKTFFDDCRCYWCMLHSNLYFPLKLSSDPDDRAGPFQNSFLAVVRDSSMDHILTFQISAESGEIMEFGIKFEGQLPLFPHDFQFSWEALDSQVGKFSADPVANMPLTQDTGKLTVYMGDEDEP